MYVYVLEIALLNRVLDRFALASSDESFDAAVNTLLCPTLQILTSQEPGKRVVFVFSIFYWFNRFFIASLLVESRSKVLSVLSHVNKRVKNNHAISLPVSAENINNGSLVCFVLFFSMLGLNLLCVC